MRHAEQRSDNRRFGGYPFQLSLRGRYRIDPTSRANRSEEHTSELQSHLNLVCRLLLEKKKNSEHIGCQYSSTLQKQSHPIHLGTPCLRRCFSSERGGFPVLAQLPLSLSC